MSLPPVTLSTPMTLAAALGHNTTLEAFDLAVRSAFGLEDPARGDGLGSRRQFDKLPSPIACEGEDLLACGSFPVLTVRQSKGFPLIAVLCV